MTEKKEQDDTLQDVEVFDDDHPLMKQIREENPEFFDEDGDVSITWRYGLIKVAEPEFDGDDLATELVELYLDKEGVPHSWSAASLNSAEALRMALSDVENNPVVTKFYDEGTFTWETQSGGWNWAKHETEQNLGNKRKE